MTDDGSRYRIDDQIYTYDELRKVTAATSPMCRRKPGATAVWKETSKPVDRLASGAEYRLRRWELPDDHPQRLAGSMHDDLVLSADNVLVEIAYSSGDSRASRSSK